MELGYGLLITAAIAAYLAAGGKLPPWLLSLRLWALPALAIVCLILYAAAP